MPAVPDSMSMAEGCSYIQQPRSNTELDVDKADVYDHGTIRTNMIGVDHTQYHPSSWLFRMTVVACSMALCASQVQQLLYLTLATTIALQLDAPELSFWLLSSPIIAFGAIAPFVGPFTDLLGRKSVFIGGVAIAVVGCIVSAATPTAPGFIAGQALIGAGAAIEELLAIAIVGEIVPTAKRPLYAALILLTIVPFTPGALYGNLMAVKSWRWVGLLLAIWNLLVLCLLVPFYQPLPRVNSQGLSKREIFCRVDFLGGIIITVGIVFLSIALSWGGADYAWDSPRVISFLSIGLILIAGFFAWQWKGFQYPLFPRRMVYAPRPFFCMLFVVFAAGVCFIPLTAFWAIEIISVYDTNRIETGIYSIPLGVCILGGAILSALLLGFFEKHVSLILGTFCVMLTVGSACLAVASPDRIITSLAPAVFSLIGIGGVLVPNQVIMTIISPDDLIGSVTALTLAVRAQAQVVGLAIFYNQFVNQVNKNSYKFISPAAIQIEWLDMRALTDMMSILTSVPFKEFAPSIPQLADPTSYQIMHDATVQVFIASFRHIWLITMAFGIPACLAALFMGDLSKYMDGHVAAPLP